MVTEQDIVEYPLLMLEKIGIFSKTQSTKVTITATLGVLVTLFIECVCLIHFYYIKGDVTEFTFNSEALGGIIQVQLKGFLIAYQRKDLIKLIESTNSFWETNKCSSKLKSDLDNISSNILKMEKMFFGCACICIALVEMSLILGRPVPVGIWKIEGYNLLYILYLAAQMLYLPFTAIIIGGYDSLFLALCTKTVIQFRILSRCITELTATGKHLEKNKKKYRSDLNLCIQHHIFLLRFVKALQSMYSPVLCVQYLTSSSLICIDMYLLLEDTSTALQVRQTIFVLTQIVQLAFYCIAADYVVNETLEVPNAIYSSGWHNLEDSTSLRSIITIAIQRSQQQTYFTAGGLVEFNARALLNVLKASWSLCTVMRRMQNRK